MARRLLRLTWLDETGEAYHTADHPPALARELLKRARLFVIDFPGTSRGHPLRHLTHAAIARSNRGAIARAEGGSAGGNRVLITLPQDG